MRVRLDRITTFPASALKLESRYMLYSVRVHYNEIISGWSRTSGMKRGETQRLRTCGNIPGRTPTLADMFRGNVSTSEYVPPERFRVLWIQGLMANIHTCAIMKARGYSPTKLIEQGE